MATRDNPDEVARAVEYRRSLARREAARVARLRALAGSRTARAALADVWAPVKPDPRYPEQPPAPRSIP